MNKSQLVEAISKSTDVDKKTVDAVLSGLDVAASQALRRGEEVVLPGLGKLKAQERAARTGRNPQTGEAVEIAAKTVVKFSPGAALKDFVN
ncbi:HU family DNA-binding protein [Hydrocarboniphaga effusa]|uniref:HU family DNA-binding protein n=1 Tax=Hydrocarboniphaga effusa TaxID=243629 RepID=UPI003BA95272